MNDSEKTELTAANDNPWYWLATLFGEQTGDLIDDVLAKKNRIAWNRWVSEALNEKERTAIIDKGFDAAELTPFSDAEKKEHYAAVLKRSGRESITLPEPSEPADFDSNRFDNFCYFVAYLFPSPISFESSTFCKHAKFWTAIFSSRANFSSVTFSREAYFSSAKFSRGADFGSATFSRHADFNLGKFSEGAFFRSATFCRDADFRSATFSAYADFKSATFSWANYGSAIFSENANFWSTIFREAVNFGSAKFALDADFVNTKFLTVTAFSNAVFRSATPKFFGATLHEGTAWDGVEWPSPPHDRDNRKKIEAAQQQVYAYERLKQEMEKLKKHEDEQFFFRKELRARRELYTWRSTYWWLNFFYENLSNYGYGVVRPLVAFTALFFFGFALLAADPLGFAGKTLSIGDAAFTSLANMFGSLPLKTLAHYTTDKTFAYSAEIFAIFQTIAGAVLLFLFFLALRNRFRLR